MVEKKTKELEIGRYLVPVADGCHLAQRDPTNHCVPFLDAFLDPVVCDTSYIVMPLLRPFDDPAFEAIGEVIEFVTQVLEVPLIEDSTAFESDDGKSMTCRAQSLCIANSSRMGRLLNPNSRVFHQTLFAAILLVPIS